LTALGIHLQNGQGEEVNLSTSSGLLEPEGFLRFIPSTSLRGGSEPRLHPALKGGASPGRTVTIGAKVVVNDFTYKELGFPNSWISDFGLKVTAQRGVLIFPKSCRSY